MFLQTDSRKGSLYNPHAGQEKQGATPSKTDRSRGLVGKIHEHPHCLRVKYSMPMTNNNPSICWICVFLFLPAINVKSVFFKKMLPLESKKWSKHWRKNMNNIIIDQSKLFGFGVFMVVFFHRWGLSGGSKWCWTSALLTGSFWTPMMSLRRNKNVVNWETKYKETGKPRVRST